MFAKLPVRQMSDYTQTLDSEDKRTATRVAALDIGSNSFHLVVARIVANDVQILHRLKMKVQLARGLDADNWLSDDAIARGVDHLRMINESLGDFEPDSVRAVATFTLRQARNARQFLTAARDVFPYPIEIIRGMEEARLIYQGVAHTQHAGGRRMVVDIGGGSTELILGDGFDPIALTSLQMGCVTFTNRFFRDGAIKQKQFDKAITAAVQIMEIAPEQFHELDWEQTLGSSGSIRAVTEQAMAMSGDAGDRHVTRKQIKELVSLCVSAGHVDELPFENISEERRRVFPAGLAILKGIFDAIDIKELMYSPAALREGVIYDMEDRLSHHDIRERTAQSLATRYDVDLDQAQRVLNTTWTLFDAVSVDWKLDQQEYRSLLGWAALLHEVGLQINSRGVQRHSGYILQNVEMPGFNQEQQQLVASLVRFHRKKFKKSEVREFSLFAPPEIERLIALLRLGVLINIRRQDDTTPFFRIKHKKNELRLTFEAGWLSSQPVFEASLLRECIQATGLGVNLEIR